MNNDSGLTFGFVVLAILGITVRIVIPLAGVIIGFVLVKKRDKKWLVLSAVSLAILIVSAYFFFSNL
ncbi:MAG: hypothetical protein VB035_14550 [Candidatus Fimivivens sp.]|nr:hypothetical protein [Candidatus Fimivivens sp.]